MVLHLHRFPFRRLHVGARSVFQSFRWTYERTGVHYSVPGC